MKKRNYRAQKVNEIRWEAIAASVSRGQSAGIHGRCRYGRAIWGIDGQRAAGDGDHHNDDYQQAQAGRNDPRVFSGGAPWGPAPVKRSAGQSWIG